MNNGVMLAKHSASEGAACPIWGCNLPPFVAVGQLKQQVFCLTATEHPWASTAIADYRDDSYSHNPR